jgi:hypothetical protein
LRTILLSIQLKQWEIMGLMGDRNSSYGPPPPPGYGYPPPVPPGYGYPPPGYGYPPPGYGYPPPGYGYQRSGGSGMAVAGGLISGVLALLMGVFYLTAMSSFYSYIPDVGFLLVCGALMTIFGLIALFGGILAIQKKAWAFTLVASIFAMISIGPAFISSILGLIGLILIVISKDEFYS